MENNVNITLEKYNRLRDFFINHKSEYKRVELKQKEGYSVFLLTNDEAIKSLSDQLIEANKTIDKVREMYNKLSISYSTFKAMSIDEFKKFKKQGFTSFKGVDV